jgi:2-dehydropantoate 2-reductase
MPAFRILVYGPGVIGSFYASRLCAGNDVTLLAHGRRLEELRESGLRLLAEETGAEEAHDLPVIESLEPDDRYDFILVTMRCQQALEILPALRANCSPCVAFLMNGVTSYGRWREALGSRLITGFPILGGEVRGGVVRYAAGLTKKGGLAPTWLGAPGGSPTPALLRLAGAMEACGLPVRVNPNMRDYHFMHVALVSPIANALYRCGGSNYELAKNSEVLRAMLRSMREGFRALRRKGIRVTPKSLNMFRFLPLWLLVKGAAKMLDTEHMEVVAARHARNARDEMEWLYKELMEFVSDAGVEMRETRELGKIKTTES